MNVSRRTILGAFLTLPLTKGTLIQPTPKLAHTDVTPILLNGRPMRGSDFKEIVEVYSDTEKRYTSTARFRAKHGLVTLGKPVEITYRGTMMFSGVARMIKTDLNTFDKGYSVSFRAEDEIEAVDPLSLLPSSVVLDITDHTGLGSEELMKRFGDGIMGKIRQARRV